MSNKGIGTLANLGKILEEALDPESQVREDKRESKSKTLQRTSSATHKKKAIDPKRKAWYEKRLREQAEDTQMTGPITAPPIHILTRESVENANSGLLNALAAAKETKPKDGTKRPEAWKRKPGDPIF